MKIFIILGLIAACILALPYKDQIALANSLQVGRDEDPTIWDCSGCSPSNEPLKSHYIEQKAIDVKALLSVYSEYTVLAFRYTATLKNVWQDLLWAIQVQDQHSCDGCKVQKQYEDMWNTIRLDIVKDLQQSPKTHRLIITGISLGGGLADLAFVDIRLLNLFDGIEVVTFGAPRVGNRKWADWFSGLVVTNRFYISSDPIPALPVCLTLICNYKQTVTAISCNKKTQICKQSCGVQENNKMNFLDVMNNFSQMHKVSKEINTKEVGSIIDHIYGYKQLYPYTLVSC